MHAKTVSGFTQAVLIAISFALTTVAGGAIAECTNQPYALEESKLTMGPAHHPMGRPLPPSTGFNQPNLCVDNQWIFDNNLNGLADPGEVRVFGLNRQVDCSSCHGESPDVKSLTAQSVFLRQDPKTLCLVCHNL